jgi:NHL repeat
VIFDAFSGRPWFSVIASDPHDMRRNHSREPCAAVAYPPSREAATQVSSRFTRILTVAPVLATMRAGSEKVVNREGQGHVYVADMVGGAVREFSSTVRLLGTIVHHGVSIGAVSSPAGLAVGGQGRLFVADQGSNTIKVFAPTGKLLQIWFP